MNKHFHLYLFFSNCSVCRKWKNCISYPVLWKKVDVKFAQHNENQNKVVANFFEKIPYHAKHLRMDFTNCFTWTDPLKFESFAMGLHERCPDLQTLILHNAKLSDSLPSIIDLCAEFLENVQVLAIYHSIFNRKPTKIKYGNISKIQVLNLFGCWGLKHSSYEVPFSKMPYLKMLFLTSTDADSSLFRNNASFLKQLDKLDLGYTQIGSWTLKRIQNIALNLRELYICHALVEDTDLNFKISENVFPKLETICLRFCETVTHIGVLSLIQSCQTLQDIFVDKRVATSYATHPFAIADRCKLEIVKFVSACSHYKRINYLHD